MDFFDQFDTLLKTFWYVAIPTTIIFLIQTIITFMGVDSSDGLNADFDSDFNDGDTTFQLFSLRNLINFLLGFSWTGISFYNTINNPILLITVSVIVGFLFVFLFFIIIKQVQKLEEDNSFKLENTLNKSAEVYLTIPEKKTGKGKISISINGTFHELDAVTEHDEKINSGSIVKVEKIENNNILIVKPI